MSLVLSAAPQVEDQECLHQDDQSHSEVTSLMPFGRRASVILLWVDGVDVLCVSVWTWTAELVESDHVDLFTSVWRWSPLPAVSVLMLLVSRASALSDVSNGVRETTRLLGGTRVVTSVQFSPTVLHYSRKPSSCSRPVGCFQSLRSNAVQE